MSESGSNIHNLASHTEQSNSVRLIYTMFRDKPNTLCCKLHNGFYLAKVSRSDGLLRFTETDMHSIVRSVLFMHAFEVSTSDSMLDMINTGQSKQIKIDDIEITRPKPLTLRTARYVLDTLFGKNFTMITRHAVNKVMLEYMREWRYFVVGTPIRVPSANDFIKIYRFANVVSPCYSDVTAFINTNIDDHKVFLQTAVKRLDRLNEKRNTLKRRAARSTDRNVALVDMMNACEHA